MDTLLSVNYNRVCNNQSCSVKEYRHYSSSVKWESTKYDPSIYELGSIILVSMNMCIYSVYVWYIILLPVNLCVYSSSCSRAI